VWIDALGRKAGTVYFDSLGHRRAVTPPEFHDDDGNLVATGDEATAAWVAHVDQQQAKRQEALRKMPAKVRRDYATYLRSGRIPEARARAPREARNDRPRGSRRSSVRRSSERSGDSGEGSEPPGRTCACGCGFDISHRAPQAKYLNDQHAAAARQRRKRSRVRDWSPDVSRRDPYFRLDAAELERLRRRIEGGCRCNGRHIADADDGHCVKCGHRRGWRLPDGKTVPSRSFVSSRAPARRKPRLGDRKRKPVRKFVDESIVEVAA
jgi:hypothetical protein